MKFENDAERIAMIVSINSIIGNLLLSLGKLIAGFVAQSAAMVSDGIHSASDVFGTLIVMAGVKFSNKASDEDHPYGHERIECIAAVLLAIILTIIALLIGYSGYEKIVGDPAELEVPGQLALSSVGAFIGILGARMGYPILDPIASLVICVMILYAAYEVFKDSMDKMVDRSCDEETTIAMEDLVSRVPGVEHLDSLHSRLFGSRIYVDIEISVKDNLTLLQAHHIAEMVHTAVEANFPLVKHCMVHVNPLSEDSHEACTMLPPDLRPHNLHD